jgi:hypothetical protein
MQQSRRTTLKLSHGSVVGLSTRVNDRDFKPLIRLDEARMKTHELIGDYATTDQHFREHGWASAQE